MAWLRLVQARQAGSLGREGTAGSDVAATAGCGAGAAICSQSLPPVDSATLIGTWRYNIKKCKEYTISREADGSLRWEGPHSDGGKLGGTLRPEDDGWFAARLAAPDGVHGGAIRLRYCKVGPTLISNFKSSNMNEWGKDITACKVSKQVFPNPDFESEAVKSEVEPEAEADIECEKVRDPKDDRAGDEYPTMLVAQAQQRMSVWLERLASMHRGPWDIGSFRFSSKFDSGNCKQIVRAQQGEGPESQGPCVPKAEEPAEPPAPAPKWTQLPEAVATDLKWFVWNAMWKIGNSRCAPAASKKRMSSINMLQDSAQDAKRSDEHFVRVLKLGLLSVATLHQVKRLVEVVGERAAAAVVAEGLMEMGEDTMADDAPAEFDPALWAGLVAAIKKVALVMSCQLLEILQVVPPELHTEAEFIESWQSLVEVAAPTPPARTCSGTAGEPQSEEDPRPPELPVDAPAAAARSDGAAGSTQPASADADAETLEASGGLCFDVSVRADCEGTPFSQADCQWFNFSVSGPLAPSSKLKFRLLGLSRFNGLDEFGGILLSEGLKPVVRSFPSRPRWQYINGETGVERLGKRALAFTFEHTVAQQAADGDELQFAVTFPYCLSQIRQHVSDIKHRLTSMGLYVHSEYLCNSLAGHPIELLTFTSASGMSPDRQLSLPCLPAHNRPHIFPGRQVVFISARVHPGEAPASYVLEGLLDFLASPAPEAKVLLERYVFHVIPVLNPDGVELGHQRTDTRGENLNRVYGHASLDTHPAIFAAEAACVTAHREQGRLRLYLDLHAHATRRGQFVLGDAKGEGQVAAKLFACALGRRCSTFEFAQSEFEHTVAGTGKTEIAKRTGSPLCFTLESHYYRGHHSIVPYEPPVWRDLGKCCLEALLDLDALESSAPDSDSLAGVRQRIVSELIHTELVLLGCAKPGSGPSRCCPQFATVFPTVFDENSGSFPLHHPSHGLLGVTVELIDHQEDEGLPECFLTHDDQRHLWLSNDDLETAPAQLGRFFYGVVHSAVVTLEASHKSRQTSQLPAGVVLEASERRMVDGRLRVRIEADNFCGCRNRNCWISEFIDGSVQGACDPRLGAQAQLLRLKGPSTRTSGGFSFPL